MIEVKKDKTSVWVLQPNFKVDLKDINSLSSIDEAKALAKALPHTKIIGSTIVPLERLRPKEFFGT